MHQHIFPLFFQGNVLGGWKVGLEGAAEVCSKVK